MDREPPAHAARRGHDDDDSFRPLSARARVGVLLLAIGTALLVMFALIERPGGVHGPARTPDAPACEPGRSTGCVGGHQPVTVIPAAAGASAGAAAGTPGR